MLAPHGSPYKPSTTLLFSCEDARVIVQNMSALKNPFRGEFLRYRHPELLACPFRIEAETVMMHGALWLSVQDEAQLTWGLVQRKSGPWDMARLVHKRVPGHRPHLLDVIDVVPIDLELEREKARIAATTSTALKALQISNSTAGTHTSLVEKSRGRGRGEGRGRGRRGRRGAAAVPGAPPMPAPAPRGGAPLDPVEEFEHESGSRSESDPEWHNALEAAEATARMHAAVERAARIPLRSGGYVWHEGKQVGRVWCSPVPSPDPSAHVSCFKAGHVRCSRWVRLRSIPDTRLLRLWVVQNDFPDAESHLATFDDVTSGRI